MCSPLRSIVVTSNQRVETERLDGHTLIQERHLPDIVLTCTSAFVRNRFIVPRNDLPTIHIPHIDGLATPVSTYLHVTYTGPT